MLVELLLEYRREYLGHRLLYKAVYGCWHSQISYASLWFGYFHPPDWLRLILSCPQLFPDILAVFQKVCAKFFNRHTVYPCRSFIPDDLQICCIEILTA